MRPEKSVVMISPVETIARYAVFDDTRTKIMGDAFDAVCNRLHGRSYPDCVREAIADRIVQIAQSSSESDPERLAAAVVASLGFEV